MVPLLVLLAMVSLLVLLTMVPLLVLLGMPLVLIVTMEVILAVAKVQVDWVLMPLLGQFCKVFLGADRMLVLTMAPCYARGCVKQMLTLPHLTLAMAVVVYVDCS